LLHVDDKTERDRLFEGGSVIAEPKSRTADEIKAKYRKTGTGVTYKETEICYYYI
jgi:hypothetical protein